MLELVHRINQTGLVISMVSCQIGPYLPCLRIADRALLAEYPRYMHNKTNETKCAFIMDYTALIVFDILYSSLIIVDHAYHCLLKI